MTWKCFFLGCKWQLIGLHIGREVMLLHRCERCQAERWSSAE